jgi:hypothetical protein
MSSNIPGPRPEPEPEELRAEAQRWVRRRRILYTILGIYAVLSLMWFAIDMADGTENLWFYWPMLGTGIAVVNTAIVLHSAQDRVGARRWLSRVAGKLPVYSLAISPGVSNHRPEAPSLRARRPPRAPGSVIGAARRTHAAHRTPD